ncbi:MAG: hypothetical protein M3077_09335 [Candidatus Dormibacteraeota bacterium]|nr:hypothetical protein [Candidatus Dormibacteraeota bacterium]
MTHLAGILLALALLAVYAYALLLIWRVPFRAIGVLVAGMAFHNIMLMFMLGLNTPTLLVRVVQAWKEGILVLLLVMAVWRLVTAWREGKRPVLSPLDLVVAAFTALTLLYLVLPAHLLHSSANLHQRLLGARLVLLLPALYLLGRVFQPRQQSDIRWVVLTILGAGAVVGLFGLFELWFLPTRVWLDWGVNQLSAFLGFAYNGPRGLPANFFQTTAEGFLLRRMVSTYVSPLGVAYAGILIVPPAVALLLSPRERGDRRPLIWLAGVLLVLGIVFSLTRLALVVLVLELLFLAVVTRRRWLLYAAPVVGVMVVFVLVQYVQIGPLMNQRLQPIAHRPSNLRITSRADPSLNEHSSLLAYDVQYVLHHPLGTGLGSSVHRFGISAGTGESAVFDMFGELGLLGGLLYLVMYAGMLLVAALAAWRRRTDPLLAALPLVALVGGLALAPITLTSDVYGDFATTFLLWWSAGSAASLALSDAVGASPGRPGQGLGIARLWPRSSDPRQTS